VTHKMRPVLRESGRLPVTVRPPVVIEPQPIARGDALEPVVLGPDVVIRELVDVDFTDESPENRQAVADFLTTHGIGLGRALVDVQRVARTFVRHLEEPGTVAESDWRDLAETLNRLIPAKVARVTLEGDPDDPPWSLQEGLAVQLWNLILSDRPVVKCARQSCGTWFTKQRGDPSTTAISSKVRFCSVNCATLDRVHRYRAKKRAEAAKKSTKGKKQ